MPRIPIYQQQQAPNQAATSGRAQAVHGDLGLSSVAQGLQDVGNVLLRREDEDARLWANKASEEAANAASELLIKTKETAPAGADNFVEAVDAEFSKYREQSLRNAPNPRAREHLAAELDRTHGTLKRQAMVYQAGERVRYRGTVLKESADEAAKNVYTNPDDFEYRLGKINANIQATEGIDPATRAEISTYARQQLSWQATLGRIDRDPEGWAKAEPEGSAWNLLGAKEQRAARDYAEIKVHQIEVERRLKESEERAKRAEYREVLRQRITDQTAMAYDGQAVRNPISRNEFAAAGLEEDDYQAYKDTLQMGPDFASLAGMSPGKMGEFLQAKKPTEEKGFAREVKQYEALQNAAVGILKERQDDPVAFASRRGLATVGQLDPSQPEAFSVELRNRAAVSKAMQSEYGTPRALLTKDEAAGFSQMLNDMTAVEKTGLLQQLRQSVPDQASFNDVLVQLRPDSPVTSMAGAMLAKQAEVRTSDGGWFAKPSVVKAADVAQRVLQGEDLLNPTKAGKAQDGRPKFAMPKDSQLREAWTAYTGDAYRGAPDVHDTVYQAYRAFYASTVAQSGQYDGAMNEEAATLAARAVSGGVMDVGGASIVLPWGMDEEIARDKLEAAWKKARFSAGLPDHVDLDTVQLQTVSDGNYLVTAGTGPLRDKGGKLIYLRIGGKP